MYLAMLMLQKAALLTGLLEVYISESYIWQ